MTSRLARRGLCLALLLAVLAATAAAEELPRVKLFATGGTISNHPDGRITADQLLRALPDLDRFARVEAVQFSNVASSQLTLDQWLQLARAIRAAFGSDAGLAGVVVTSGTDTLEELAYFLHLTAGDDRPVVLVGSMRHPAAVGSDGAANLLAAIRVAASPHSRRKGALVVLNDEINSARDATKTDALRLHTFQSRSYGVLGVVDADRVSFYRQPTRRLGAGSEFDVSSIPALPRVDVLLGYQQAPGDLVRAAVDRGAKGLVVAAVGAGSLGDSQFEGVRYALEKNVPVVIATRTGGGRVPARSQQAEPSGSLLIAGEDLTPVKARVLLMLALTRTADPAEIQRMFLEY
jgi:L-asparaginase